MFIFVCMNVGMDVCVCMDFKYVLGMNVCM